MQALRKHYFPANDETVFTGLCPNGEFGARRADDAAPRGYGHTRLAAIADLNEAIEKVGSVEERANDLRLEVA